MDAGAAHAALLGQADARTVAGGAARTCDAARPSTDDKQIEISH
jgi:hypothetical protein